MSLKTHLSTFALTLVAACGSEPLAELHTDALQASHEIRGGFTDPWDVNVVGLFRFGFEGSGACSGTLITPNVVLTAQHCVAPIENSAGNGGINCAVTRFGTVYNAGSIYVTTTESLGRNPRDYVKASRVLVPESRQLVCGNDIALLVLETPIHRREAVPRLPRIDEPLEAGEIYHAIGYGATDGAGNGSGTRRRIDNLEVQCVGRGCPIWTATASEWSGQTGVCSGDSGGPAVDEWGRVVGVASRGGPNCSRPVYAGVEPWADWIMDESISAADRADIDRPSWAMGWPTHPDYHGPVGGRCEERADCEPGVCHSRGYCTRMCHRDAPCPEGYRCDPENEVCEFIDLEFGEFCGDDTPPCRSLLCGDEGTCTSACSTDGDCPDGLGCEPDLGYCVDAVRLEPEPAFPMLGCETAPGLGIWALCALALLIRRRRVA